MYYEFQAIDSPLAPEVQLSIRVGPNRWREVALLAGAKAARGTASAVWSLVESADLDRVSRVKAPTTLASRSICRIIPLWA